MIPAIVTKEGVSFVVSNRQYNVARSDPHFKEVENLIHAGAPGWEITDVLERVAKKVKEAVKDGIEYNGGAVTYNGEQLRGYAVDKLLDFFGRGYDVTPLKNFLEKVQANPSKTVVDNLYSFLEHGKMPLTADGNFVAYKAVRYDFKDIHSGTMDNSVGKTVSITRNKVDEDRNRTCSTGLHVCSFEYLPHFSHADGHVLLVEVNPKDVVAIPADYNNTKMRVCEYTVIGEVEDYYSKRVNVLSEDPIWDETYTVMLDEEAAGEFDSFVEARQFAIDSEADLAEVIDSEGNVLFFVGNND